MNIINILTIILSALSLMFAIFTAFIALLVFLGWRNAKDLDRKGRDFIAKQRQIISNAEEEIIQNRKKFDKFINELDELKSKIKTPKDFKEYESKTEELINKLKDAIKDAEDRVGELRISSSSTVLPSSGSLYGISALGASEFNGAGSYIITCKKCGHVYSKSPLTLANVCPFCGEIN